MYVPDNYSQWEYNERKRDAWLASRPVCYRCGEPIQGEVCTAPDTGADVCEDCWWELAENEGEEE